MVVGGTAGGFRWSRKTRETGGRLLFLVDFVGSRYRRKLSWINGDRLASLFTIAKMTKTVVRIDRMIWRMFSHVLVLLAWVY
jgi:hypothetical protein